MRATATRIAVLAPFFFSGCNSESAAPSVEPSAQAAGRAAAAPPPTERAKAVPAGRTVYDFFANRVAAHQYRDGALEIDCGTPGFHKYTLGGMRTGWSAPRMDDGKKVSFVLGVGASLQVPLDGDAGGPGLKDVRLRATLRPIPARQRVSVFVNEQPLGNVDLVPGWQTIDLPIGAQMRKGENALRFYFRGAGESPAGRSAAAFERIVIAPGSATPGWRSSYYLQIPENTALRVGPGFQVRAASGAGTARPVAGDLGDLQGEAARLDFLSNTAEVLEARLEAPEPAAPPAERGKARHVLIWMIDTLRPDHVGCYNPKTRVKTPSLDAFAKKGVLFRNATVQGNWSLTSHASLLSGVYPSVHRGYSERTRIRDEIDMAAEIFGRSGFTSATFLSNGYVSEGWGFGQGWGHYRNFIRESRPSDAKALWTETLAWLKKRRPADERLFLYLGTIDPHVIYNPPADYLAMYDADPYAGIVKPNMTGLLLGKIKAGKTVLKDRDKRRLEALYDGEITYNDFWFGRMQQDLEALGMLKDTVIVVVSDHGDEFYEHGSVGHGHSVFEELVATPLLMAGPGLAAGREVGPDVETIDVLPTLLELAGVPAPAAVQGESLLALVDDPASQPPRPAFSTHGGTLRGMKLGRYKLISSGPEQTRLYDLREDPREQRDIALEQPIAARHARDVFGIHVAHEERWRKARWGVASNLRPAFATDVGF